MNLQKTPVKIMNLLTVHLRHFYHSVKSQPYATVVSVLLKWRPVETRIMFGIHINHVLTQLGVC